MIIKKIGFNPSNLFNARSISFWFCLDSIKFNLE